MEKQLKVISSTKAPMNKNTVWLDPKQDSMKFFDNGKWQKIIGGADGNVHITNVEWTSESDMNDFKTPGTYSIYGERTRQGDNLPILNASSGHSIAARLIVVASTLQPANDEICITQFLMLSNRKGGDGNMYVRTYNENNSPAPDWWTPWQKLQGIKEGYIFTDTIQVNPDGGVQQIDGVTGVNNMIDNGIYSGIYTDDPTFQAPTFIDTFTLIVINNYAVVGKSGGLLKRTISQLKYAVDALTNQSTVKKRIKTDGGDWSDWEDIGGSSEVDITDAVKTYGLPTLGAQGFAKEGVDYIMNLTYDDINYLGSAPVVLDNNNKIVTHLKSKVAGSVSTYHLSLKLIKDSYNKSIFELIAYELDGSSDGKYYRYIISKDFNSVKVSADMIELT